MAELTPCIDCEHPVSDSALRCPNCGKAAPTPKMQKENNALTLVILSPLLAMLVFILILFATCS